MSTSGSPGQPRPGGGSGPRPGGGSGTGPKTTALAVAVQAAGLVALGLAVAVAALTPPPADPLPLHWRPATEAEQQAYEKARLVDVLDGLRAQSPARASNYRTAGDHETRGVPSVATTWRSGTSAPLSRAGSGPTTPGAGVPSARVASRR